MSYTDEESHLLGNGHSQNKSSSDGNGGTKRRLFDVLGGALVATLVMYFVTRNNNGSETFATSSSSSASDNLPPHVKPPTEYKSKYTHFQALGFQIYTGGAPLVVRQNVTTSSGHVEELLVSNPECHNRNSYGHADDFDEDDVERNTTTTLWQCYLGLDNVTDDVEQRLDIMRAAVERAYDVASRKSDTLKIFIAPEFFWRGPDGAYMFDKDKPIENLDDDEDCTEVCRILQGLEGFVADQRFQDWLFLFGTVIVSEALPKEDAYDYLFYNFAPMYKGYDPDTSDHFGKRFLVPKRYVSNIDFLTPVRQYNDTTALELVELQKYTSKSSSSHWEDNNDDDSSSINPTPIQGRIRTTKHQPYQEPNHQQSTIVQNPFALERDFYDRDMWYTYKEELTGLGYTMIEYDWLILDDITFSIEVCLDHEARTALNTYLADNVMGSRTLIPRSYEHRHGGGQVEYVGIPRHQAQLSLVSSSGMTVNPQSMALVNNGTILLQDGLSSRDGSMAYSATEDSCGNKHWHFAGGNEHISRQAKLSETDIGFSYAIHKGHVQVGIFDDLQDDSDNTWKSAIAGVFTTAKYEPKITVYEPRPIASVE